MFDSADTLESTDVQEATSPSTHADSVFKRIPVEAIEPDMDQPRSMLLTPAHLENPQELTGGFKIEYEELKALADTIASGGQSNPIEVFSIDDGRYQLITGERRWLAAHLNMDTDIDARIYPCRPKNLRLKQLVENLARKDLSTADTARALETVVAEAAEEGHKVGGPAELGRLVGLRKTSAFRWYNILTGPGDVLRAVKDGHIHSPNVAANIAGIKDRDKRAGVIQVAKDGKSRQAIDKAIDIATGKAPPPTAATPTVDGAEVKAFSVYPKSDDRPDPLAGAVIKRPNLDADGRPLRSAFTSDVVGAAGTGDGEKRQAKPAKQLTGGFASDFEKKRGGVVIDQDTGDVDEGETAKRVAAEESANNRGRAAMEKMQSLASGGVQPSDMAGAPESASLTGQAPRKGGDTDTDPAGLAGDPADMASTAQPATPAGDMGAADTKSETEERGGAATGADTIRIPALNQIQDSTMHDMLEALSGALVDALGPAEDVDELPRVEAVSIGDPGAVHAYLQEAMDVFFASWHGQE